MTRILAVASVARIGRRSEHAPGDGMTFRQRLIRSDEAGSERQTLRVSASAHYQRASSEWSNRAVDTNGLLAEIGPVHKANYA